MRPLLALLLIVSGFGGCSSLPSAQRAGRRCLAETAGSCEAPALLPPGTRRELATAGDTMNEVLHGGPFPAVPLAVLTRVPTFPARTPSYARPPLATDQGNGPLALATRGNVVQWHSERADTAAQGSSTKDITKREMRASVAMVRFPLCRCSTGGIDYPPVPSGMSPL